MSDTTSNKPTNTDMTCNIVGRAIVAGVDGSTSALHAVRWAAKEADIRRVPLHLVHGVNIAAVVVRRLDTSTSLFEAMEYHGRRYLTEAEIAARQAHPGVEITVELRSSPILALDRPFPDQHDCWC